MEYDLAIKRKKHSTGLYGRLFWEVLDTEAGKHGKSILEA
jgi:hypothetical protein